MRGAATGPGRRLAALWAVLLLVGCAEGRLSSADGERPSVEVEASTDRVTATAGDLITYTLRVSHDPEWEVELPRLGDEIGGLEVVEQRAEPVRQRKSRRIVDHWYVLRADLVGSYSLPAVEIEARPATGEGGETSVLATEAIAIEVASVLPAEGTPAELRDIKPLRQIRLWDWRPWAAGLGAAALAAALLVWWWRRRNRPRPEAPPIPPHELALERLDALHQTQLSDLAAVRRYYFAISEIVRSYVEGRFGLNATDLTTEEIVGRLEEVPELKVDESRGLVSFLVATDAVKYAARVPSEDDVVSVYEGALGFVETTRPSVEEAA